MKDLKALVEQSIRLMAGQPVAVVEMSSGTYAQLLLADLFAVEADKLGGVEVVIDNEAPVDMITWISDDHIAIHKLMIPIAAPAAEPEMEEAVA